MSWEIKKKSEGGYVKPPVGNHSAVLVALIDMGKQWQDPYTPKDKGYWARRAFFLWELVGEQIAGTDKNHVIGIDLNLSTGKKAKLRAFIEGRTGKPITEPFDPTTEVGQPCFLNVVLNDGGFPVVKGMAAFPKGIPAPVPTYPVTVITLEEFKAGKPLPEWVPWLYGNPLEEHIRACQEIGGDKPKPRKAEQGEPKAEAAPVPF